MQLLVIFNLRFFFYTLNFRQYAKLLPINRPSDIYFITHGALEYRTKHGFKNAHAKA